MPEERPTAEDQTLIEIKALREDIQALRLDTHGRLSRMESGFDQMDKRVGNIERAVTQIQWSLVSGFLITILAVILTRLLR